MAVALLNVKTCQRKTVMSFFFFFFFNCQLIYKLKPEAKPLIETNSTKCDILLIFHIKKDIFKGSNSCINKCTHVSLTIMIYSFPKESFRTIFVPIVNKKEKSNYCIIANFTPVFFLYKTIVKSNQGQ